jgi:hypothetical protein
MSEGKQKIFILTNILSYISNQIDIIKQIFQNKCEFIIIDYNIIEKFVDKVENGSLDISENDIVIMIDETGRCDFCDYGNHYTWGRKVIVLFTKYKINIDRFFLLVQSTYQTYSFNNPLISNEVSVALKEQNKNINYPYEQNHDDLFKKYMYLYEHKQIFSLKHNKINYEQIKELRTKIIEICQFDSSEIKELEPKKHSILDAINIVIDNRHDRFMRKSFWNDWSKTQYIIYTSLGYSSLIWMTTKLIKSIFRNFFS